ncbi:MAG TPA: LysM peptidoglycan-binding domain-containing protein [Marmoricola sp.]|nr:LysM peptidoglycan-binding domain-containing protein [Marmoricola sp.]
MDALGTDFDTALTRGALVALAAAGVWSLVVVLAVALEARTGGGIRIAERAGCPRALRMWLLAVFVALFAGVAPAQASDAGSHEAPRDRAGSEPHLPHRPASDSVEAIGSALDGLPLPERSTGAPGQRATTSDTHVVVRAGDSLWRIARTHLPRLATQYAVARAVDALYAANRREIGPDPDRIHPGQHLDFPDPTTLTEEP